MHSKEVTPKAVAALQKLLSCNTNHKQNLQMSTRVEVQGQHALQKSVQNHSGSQQIKDNSKYKSKEHIASPKTEVRFLFDPPMRQSLTNKPQHMSSDMKNELLHVLKKSTDQPVKKPAIKRNGNSLNQLLQPQFSIFSKHQSTPMAKKEVQQLSGRNSYKKKRPPELYDLGQDDNGNVPGISKNPHSAKSSSKNKLNPQNSGFYTTTNAKHSGNVFGSLNEVLRQYIQVKATQKQAGTGEGVKIPICQSARNAEKQNNNQGLFLSDNKKQQIIKQKQTEHVNHTNLLQNLYIKTAKLLKTFKGREVEWKQEKKTLRNEVQFLKQLLKHQEVNHQLQSSPQH